jgi:phage-related protein
MATATSQQLEMMNIQWQEQMLLATLSGQKGIKGFTDALKNGITNGTPTVAAAATALATQIGQTVGIPFTGSLTSIQQIGNALNTLPVSVLEALAGKTHQVAAANTDAANKATAATATIKQSWETVAVGLAANVALIAFGLSKTIGMVSGLATKLFGAAAAEDAVTASAIPMDAALDANPIGAIVLAAAALGVGLYELVKHFDAVSKFLNGPWGTAISAAVAVINPFIGITMLIIGHWRGVVNFFTHDIPEAINAFVGFFVAIPGRIDHIWGDVVNGLHSAWSDVANWVHGNITGPIAAFFEAIPGTIGHIWGDVVSAIHGAWSSVANWVSSTVIQPIVNAYNTITRLTSHIWSDVVSAIHGAWTAIAGWVDTVVIHPIVSFFNSIVSAIDHVWSDVVNAIHTAWSDIAHWVSTNIIDPIKKLFNDIPGAVKAALAGLAAIIEAPFAAAAGAISTIVGGIISVVHGIASAVSAATGAVSNFFAGGSGAPANPTHLTPTQLGGAQGTTPKAMGGPVSVATPYLVGEQGPEIFVPHADGTIIPNHAIQGRAAGGLVDQGSPYLIGENGAEVFIAASFGGDLNTNALTGGVGNDALSSILVSVIQSLTNAMSAVVGRLAANATTLSTLTTTIQTDITTVQADITAVNALTTALNANATAMASAAAASTTTAATVDAGTAAAAVSSAPTMADYAAVASQFPVTTDAYSMGLPNSVGSLSTTAGNLGGLGQGVVNIVPNLGPNPTGGITGGYVSPLPPAAAGDTLRQIGFQNSINPVSANYGGLGLNGTTVLHVTSPINIDGRTFASIMTQYQLKGARATGNIAGQWSGGTQNQTATRINVNAVAR